MKIYFQKLSHKINLVYNLLAATIVAGIFCIFINTDKLHNFITNNIVIAIIILLLFTAFQIITYKKNIKKETINQCDAISINSVLSSVFVILFILLENSYPLGTVVCLGFEIYTFILSIVSIAIRIKVFSNKSNELTQAPTNEKEMKISQENTKFNEKINENEPILSKIDRPREDLVDEGVTKKDNLLTEAIEITDEAYNTYLSILKNDAKSKSLPLSQFSVQRNKNILASLFPNFENGEALKEYLNKSNESIINLTSLGLNYVEVISLNFLFNIYPDLKTEIINNSDYFISNNPHSYLFKLKQLQLKLYEDKRRSYFEKLFNKYNNPLAINILSSIYNEVSDYKNNKTQKRIVKLDLPTAQSLSHYDLFLNEYSFDYFKARRQVTKFIEEYNKCQTQGEYSKCYKEFLDDVFKTDYAPTIFPYLETLINTVNNKEKLFTDIYKKASFYQSKDQIAINNYNKVINSLVIILSSLDEQKLISNLNQLYDKIEDIIFLDKFHNTLIQALGPNNSTVIVSSELLNNKLIESIVKNPSYISSKDFNKDVFQILHSYLNNEDVFKDFVRNDLNEETSLILLLAFTITEKVKNITHYDLDLRSLSEYVNKSDIIKILKQKEESNKKNALLELVKNKSLDSRLNLDPRKF